ncbi:hypothetical protein SASPL_107487 [Salvia splendens]|uniref:RRM domain-containing protein n=1 Tax=Salvia splendens TaxID=180675 RepID=A0A8X8YGI5_SALSN|nr:hypothetical protein SASPL_107487 [Salvia splendens]
MSGRFSRTIYVGNLPADIRESEVEDLFYKYGRILDIELKIPPRPPCYCFVEFENARDAEDAKRGRDGYNFDGCRLRVELAHGGRGPSSSSDRGGYSERGGGGGGGSGSSGSRFGMSRHSDYRGMLILFVTSYASMVECFFRGLLPHMISLDLVPLAPVIVRGLPSSASWQDLKDHMRKAGDVCFAEVSRDSEGTYGLVDYTNYDDMKYGMRKLDDSEFRNPWTRTYIRVKEYKGSPSRSQSGSRSRSRSRSRSPMRRRSPERSTSRSPPVSPVKPPRYVDRCSHIELSIKIKVQIEVCIPTPGEVRQFLILWVQCKHKCRTFGAYDLCLDYIWLIHKLVVFARKDLFGYGLCCLMDTYFDEKMSVGELACTYAALVLHDDGIPITAEKISTLLKAANLSVESYWPSLFAKLCEKRNVEDLIMNEEEKEESDDDMGFGLFD